MQVVVGVVFGVEAGVAGRGGEEGGPRAQVRLRINLKQKIFIMLCCLSEQFCNEAVIILNNFELLTGDKNILYSLFIIKIVCS